MCEGIRGRAVLAALAERFPQLYVAPAEDAQEAHRLAAGRGIAPEGADFGHFIGDEEDALLAVGTPAGPVEVLFLKKRADFETFLRIVGHKSQPVPIARTVGAITYRGLADWGVVAREREEYLAGGGDDWASEFKRLASAPGAFRAEIVVISEGPYSGVRAGMTPYPEEEWLRVSRDIRLNHECAHVVCRRLMPEDVLPVWDEVTADVVGLLRATGRYDARLAALFLGVTAEGFAGGRLYEYLDDGQRERIDGIAAEVHAALRRVESACGDAEAADPFGFLLRLKRYPRLPF
ncbi:MAG: hypothetical protein IJ111_14625 [Eggerthellaceae bacterium]|nr:hypothetical protein [Eggerthellaceae bacterium]